MKDNIKPEHYRTGEIDLYEAWYRTYPFNEYRAIMQAVAERYMRRDKNDRVEDIIKAIYTLERLKEKEIEHAKKNTKTPQESFDDTAKDFGSVKTKTAGEYFDEIYFNREDLLKRLWREDYRYLARDEDGALYAFNGSPVKTEGSGLWDVCLNLDSEHIRNDNFPEVKWTDNDPTKIVDLLDIYLKGGENGK